MTRHSSWVLGKSSLNNNDLALIGIDDLPNNAWGKLQRDQSGKMLFGGLVAMTALDSRGHLVQRKLMTRDRIGCVTSETAHCGVV